MKKSNKFFTKLSTVVVSLAMALGVGVAAASNGGFREVKAAVGDKFALLKSDLSEGDEIIFVGVNSSKYYSMGAQANNNRSGVEVSCYEDVVTAVETTAVFTVGIDNNKFTFQSENKYIYNASTTGNNAKSYLKSCDNVSDQGDKARWEVSINADTGVASINSVSTNRPNLKFNYNSGSPIFNCYASGQSVVYIYKYTTEVTPSKTATALEISAENNKTSLDTTASPKDSVQLSASVSHEGGTVTDPTITWTSSVPAVATVSNSGLVTAVSTGLTKITASYGGDATYRESSSTLIIDVVDQSEISFNFGEIGDVYDWENGSPYSPVAVGGVTITAEGGGNNAKYYTADSSWRVYNGGSIIITPSANHVLTSITTTPEITFEISDSGESATANITATYKITNITVSQATSKVLGSITAALTDGSKQWRVGDVISATDLTITPHYTDDTDGTPITDGVGVTVTNASLENEGENSVTVSYKEKTTTVVINAVAPEIMKWGYEGSIGHTVRKDNYDLSGLTLKAYYDEDGNDPASDNVVSNYVMVADPEKALDIVDPANTISIKIYLATDTEHANLIATIASVPAPIDDYPEGSENNPYNVAGSIAAIEEHGTMNDKYVTGIICAVEKYNSQYKSISYWISDDGSNSNTLYVYGGKGLNNAEFSGIDDVGVGDIVTICGKLKKYSPKTGDPVYEFDSNSYLVSHDPENRELLLSVVSEELLVNSDFSYSGTVSTNYVNKLPNGDVTSSGKLTFAGYDMTKVGNYEVTVTYDDPVYGKVVTGTYNLTVKYDDVKTITLNHETSSIVAGDTLDLVASLNGGASNINPAIDITWETSEPTVATVEKDSENAKNATVTGVVAGTAVITARISDTLFATCNLTVVPAGEPIVTLDRTNIADAYTGDADITLTATATNFAPLTTEYTWTSSAESVATVTKDTQNPNKATVHYLTAGETTITVGVTDGAEPKTATCKITISQSTATLSDIASTKGNKLYLGSAEAKTQLSTKATVKGNASESITWSVAPEGIITVSESGYVEAVAEGKATVTATSSTGDIKTIDIDVLAPTELKVDAKNAKTKFRIGDTFNNEGLNVKAIYADKTELDAAVYSTSTPDLTTAGDKEVEVSSFGGIKTTYTITVLKDQYYTPVQFLSDLKVGDKLLIASPAKEGKVDLMTTTIESSKYLTALANISVSDNGIKQTDAIEDCEVTLGGAEGAWTLANANGKLLGATTGTTKPVWVDATSTEATTTWTIELNEGVFVVASTEASTLGKLQYNENSGGTPRFSNYKQMTDPVIYKVGAKTPADVLAEKKAEAIAAIDAHVATLKEADYSEAGWTQITRLVSAAKEQVNACTKVEDIDPIVAQLKIDIAAVKTAAQEAAEALAKAKTDAKAELDKYFNAINQEEYTATGKQALKDALSTGKTNIDAATTVDAVATALTNAKVALAAVEKSSVTKIEVTTNPTKTTYNVGDKADYSGIVVTVTYNDQSTDTVGADKLTFEGFDTTTSGDKTITVKYGDKSTTFTITVNEAPVEDLAGAKTAAINTLHDYMQGLLDSGEYDTTGRQQLGQEYDKGIVLINSATTVAEVDTALTNAKALLDAVAKQGGGDTPEATLENIAVTTNPTTTTYTVGDEFKPDGLVITATYSDGSTKAVTGYTLSTVDMSTAGTKTITVTYNGKTATFTITVNEAATDPLEEAKANALSALDEFAATLNESDYSQEAWSDVQDILEQARAAINSATDADTLNTLVANAKAAINAVKDNLELAKEAATAALDVYYNSFDKNNYDEAGLSALRAALDNGKVDIEAATTVDGVAAALANAKAAMDKVETKPAAPAVKRCGGDIAATSIILSTLALAGVGLLVFKKRKQD